MSVYLKFALLPVLLLALFGLEPANAAYVAASSDMEISNLRFTLSDANAQLQWVPAPPSADAEWYGETRAHAADSESLPQDDYSDYLGNDGSAQAQANTNHVSSRATYAVSNGLSPAALLAGTTHSDLHLERCNMQADGFAIANYDNFFQITNANPNAAGPVNVSIQLDYSGVISGTADEQGYFLDITHIATMRLFGPNGADPLALLDFKAYQDSISGTNTSITHTANGTLTINYALDYNSIYQLSNEVDSEIYGYTPVPATLPLFLLGLAAMRRFRKK